MEIEITLYVFYAWLSFLVTAMPHYTSKSILQKEEEEEEEEKEDEEGDKTRVIPKSTID